MSGESPIIHQVKIMKDTMLVIAYAAIVLSVTCFTTPDLAEAGVDPVIFLDGFESPDAPPDEVTGTWIGTLSFPGGVDRAIVLQFHQRTNNKLLGYLPGSSEYWVMRSGSYEDGELTITLSFGSPAGERLVNLSGRVTGDSANLSLSGDLPGQSVVFSRSLQPLTEHRFIFADFNPLFGEPHFVSLAVVLGDTEQLVAGSWSGSEQKAPLARDGGVTSFTATSETVSIGLDVDGGCSAGSLLQANYQTSLYLYQGTFSLTDCTGTQSGDLVGGFVAGTTTSDITRVLAQVSAVADQMESGTTFNQPHAAFESGYLHEGIDLAGLFGSLNDELANWNNIEFDVFDISRISTRQVVNESQDLSRPLGVDFQQIRSGEPAAGGLRQDYLDTRGDMLAPVTHNQLGILGNGTGEWKIRGNQQQAFDLPWTSSAIQAGDRRLITPTGGDPIQVALGGYGGHFPPVGNHANGDRKANFAGFLPADDSELDELAGDGIGDDNGSCSPSEMEARGCAYWGELDGSLVRQRIPWYRAPQDGLVHRLTFVNGGPSDYFDGVPHWRVSLAFDSGIKMELGHVGSIAEDLALNVQAASGCDPRNWESCDGVGAGSDLLQGIAPIAINAGELLAQPQAFADAVPGQDGYHYGGGGYPEYPWAQMEFNVSSVIRGWRINTCVFGLIDSARLASYRMVMEADMADPYSQRYRPRFGFPEWAWRAEAALCNAPWQGKTGFSSLSTNLGGWFERTNAGTVSDEIVSFAAVAQDTGLYEAPSYQPGTETLILRQRSYFSAPFSWTMPDDSLIDADFPAGEILQQTASTLLVLWRNLGWAGGEVYQAATYRLDDEGLTIKWGEFEATQVAAEAGTPTLGAAEACDETTVICYFHKEQPGF